MPQTITIDKPPKPFPVCGAKSKRTGEPCQRPAGSGTDHKGYGNCKYHFGATTNGRRSAAKQQAASEGLKIARVMGFPVEVEPIQALLNTIYITAGEVEYCSIRIGELAPDEAVVSFSERVETDGVVHGETEHSVSVKRSSSAELNVWIVARRDALDRLARYAKMAIDAGVAERQVQLAERVGGMIGRVLQAVLGELALTAAQREVAPGIVRRHLELVAGGAA